MKCEICSNDLCFRWTDSHGIGACTTCGAPYTIYHYGDDGKRIADKGAELAILPEWVPLISRYWEETGKNCSPGSYNFPGSSYEVATTDDFDSFNSWMDAHRSEFPVAPDADR